ncbi:hypothetical protein JCM11957_04220 [Caminibacter profundus]
MNELEILKLKYSIIKDKVILWSAGLSGSFFAFFKIDNKIADIILIIAFSFSLYGFLFNLHKVGKIQKELEELKDNNG